jgi:serine/threonine protein kinase
MITSPQIVYNHCDIHPKNVIITFNNYYDKYQVKLIDFGEARNLIKKTNKTLKACDKGRFAAMSMNKVFSTKITNFLKRKVQGKKSFFSILLREFISLFRKDNLGRVDLRFFYMNLYLYLLLSEKINDVSNVLKELKNLINSFNPLNDNIIEILNKIRIKIQEIFSRIKPIRVNNLNEVNSESDFEYESGEV